MPAPQCVEAAIDLSYNIFSYWLLFAVFWEYFPVFEGTCICMGEGESPLEDKGVCSKLVERLECQESCVQPPYPLHHLYLEAEKCPAGF